MILLLKELSTSEEVLHEMASHFLKINKDKLIKIAKGPKRVDPEAIHDMRIATRRLRALLKTFKKILPTHAKETQKELAKFQRILGKKRDLDVFYALILKTLRVKSFPKLAKLIGNSQKKIVSTLESKHYARLIRSLKQLKIIKTEQHIFKESKKKVRKKFRIILELAPLIDLNVDDKTLHKLRISVKKLRYTCELFDTFYGTFIEKAKKIQDILGKHHDTIVGLSLLRRYRSLFSKKQTMKIQNNYERKKKRDKKSFIKIWTGFIV